MGKLLDLDAHCIQSEEPFRKPASPDVLLCSQHTVPVQRDMVPGMPLVLSPAGTEIPATHQRPIWAGIRQIAASLYCHRMVKFEKELQDHRVQKSSKITESNQVLQTMFNTKSTQDSVQHNCLF